MQKRADLSVRPLESGDLPEIEALVLANRPLFTEQECETALAVVRDGIAHGDKADRYQFLVAESARRVVAYTCFGTIPLTDGGFDLYWIVVHPGFHRGGVGRTLLLACEEIMHRQGARFVVAETSSVNEPARCFYTERMRYESAGGIRDFYRPGEDKLVYVRYLPPRSYR